MACVNNLSARLKPKTEEKSPTLLAAIHAIMEPHSESASSLRTTAPGGAYFWRRIRICQPRPSTMRLLRWGGPPNPYPISNILSRQDYRLRTAAKTPVQKKPQKTDALFDNVRQINALADEDTEIMRISIDTKATDHVGEYSRGGRPRGVAAVMALDHDMYTREKSAPGGILEPDTGRSFLFFGAHYTTSDFMVPATAPGGSCASCAHRTWASCPARCSTCRRAWMHKCRQRQDAESGRHSWRSDGIVLWWEERRHEFSGLKQLVINLDNGPECSGHRSQFLLRMTAFADMTGLCVRLVYSPPSHSKYNGIEGYWAGLEKSWHG